MTAHGAAALRDRIVEAVAGLLGVPAQAVDVGRPLTELGVSSRDAMALVGELEEHLGRRVDPTVVYRAPTIAALAEALAAGPVPAAGPDAPAAPAAPAAVPGPRTAPAARPSAHDEPVAVVGLGCRLPGGVHGPKAFWQQLVAGRESVGEVPAGRWEEFPQHTAASESVVAQTPRRGGFLADVQGFDADHFGISPREAQVVDPAQRLLLEVAWEALEHAGIAPEGLAGSATGVYVGLSTSEYSQLTMADLSRVDAWTPTGVALSVAANRLSYLLDLRGPSMTVDTACSSSLVAVHQAVRALRAGDVDTALVGGANLLLGPAVTVTFHRAGALSPDGRCKPFGAGADGIVRAEAVGVVVLKRLRDAVAAGDRVLAVVRGSEVNSDGRSNGLMAPNPAAQEALLRDAYARAGVDPATVDYVEAHGTGTLLGDPIEAEALGAVLGAGRHPRQPLLIGSVKGNLGHAEAAAGVVGLVKTVLALHHGLVPPSLHARERNPHIRFAEQGLDVATRLRPFPRYSGVARAGVSAFGFGGTNAHVLLEEHRDGAAAPAAAGDPDAVVTAVLQGADDQRVVDAAAALADHLDATPAAPLGDVAHTLARRRRHGTRRAVVTGRGRAGLVANLRALAEGREAAGVVAGLPAVRPARPGARPAADGPPGAVWVFSGYGSQWPGMGATLLADEPAFAAAVDDLAPLLHDRSGVDLHAVVRGEVTDLGVAASQVALFGVQVALAAAWRAHGHRPAAVVGQSLGEVAAAVVAGALSAEDGATVICVRSALLERVAAAGGGAMAVLELSGAELDALADRFPDVVPAVFASPRQLTVAGDAAQVAALAEHVESLGRNAWVLPVTGSGHSPAVDPVLDELVAGLAGITPTAPSVPVYTTVLDDPRATPAFDPAYWRANLRRSVRFAHAVAAAVADGHTRFVEVSPHPVAAAAVRATLAAVGAEGTVVPTLRRDTDSTLTFRAHLAVLAGTPGYVADGTADDPEGLGVPLGRQADLPLPAWRHVRHWAPPVRRTAAAGAHPLLGTPVELPEGDRTASGADVGLDALPWLTDHRVHGTAVLPAAAFAEIALAAGAHALGRGRPLPVAEVEVTDLELHRLLVLGPSTRITTTTRRTAPDAVAVDVHARTATGSARHATATVRRAAAPLPAEAGPPATDGGAPVDVHATFAAVGHRYGPAFAGAGEAVALADGRVVARVDLPREADGDPRLGVHPALLDACLQVLAPAAEALAGRDPDSPDDAGVQAVPHLPFAVGSLRVQGDPQRGGWCEAWVHRAEGTGLTGEVRLVADDGTVLLVARDVLLRPLARDGVDVPLDRKAFALGWHDEPAPAPADDAPATWLVCGAGALAAQTAAALAPRTVLPGTALAGAARAVEALPDADTAAGLGVVLVVDAPADGDDDPVGAAAVLDVAAVARALDGRADAGGPVRLVLATRDGAALDGAAGTPALAALRALVRVLALEHPLLHARLVDVGGDDPDAGTLVAAEAVGAAADDEIAWRSGVRRVRRLSRADVVPDGPVALRPGAYVVTGGLGGLGLLTAQYLAEHGATRLVLVGRSADRDAAAEHVADLAARGAQALVVAADVSLRADVDRVVAAATADGVPLRGVVHAAGVLDDELVADLTPGALHRVWAPKVLAGVALDEATRGHDLDLWCVYSSAAALLGSPGQAAYATANAWLDALVERRRAAGLPATTLGWGAWAGVGGATVGRNVLLDPLSPSEGLAALDAVLASGRAATGVVRLDVDRMVALLPGLATSGFFAPVLADRTPDGAEDDDWAGPAALAQLPAARARAAVRERLVGRVAQIMGYAPDRIDRELPLPALGVDSLMAVRAKNAVESDFGVTLPVRLLLQGASLADVERHLCAQLGFADDGTTAAAPAAATAGPADAVAVGAAPRVGTRPATVGPRDTTERWLVSVWSQALGVPPFGVTDPLADLLAQRPSASDAVADAITARFGADVDVASVLARATVEEQSDLLRPLVDGHGGSAVRVLRAPDAVTEPGDGVPLFLFHPAGGPTSVYAPMLSLMPADRPVYGLERIESARTIEEKADRYLEILRGLQPQGPYRVGGWSLGGALAYEVAHRLTAAGERVDLVVLIDSILPDRVPGADERQVLRDRFVRFFAHVEETYGAELGLDVDEVMALDEDEQVSVMMGAVARALPFVGPALLEHQRTSYVDARVAERYVPQPYDGPVLLFRATDVGLTTTLDPRYARVDDALGWDLLCRDLEVVRVEGDHTSIVDRPAVDAIAAHLTRVLERLGRGTAVAR